MPPVYATISFFSYRYFRSYTYYYLAEAVYEALAVAAFLMLLIQYVGESTTDRKKILAGKSKQKIPFPFCCWRYRPSKPYFMHTLKVSWRSVRLNVDAWDWLYGSGLFCNIVYSAQLSVLRAWLLRNIMYSVSTPVSWHANGIFLTGSPRSGSVYHSLCSCLPRFFRVRLT